MRFSRTSPPPRASLCSCPLPALPVCGRRQQLLAMGPPRVLFPVCCSASSACGFCQCETSHLLIYWAINLLLYGFQHSVRVRPLHSRLYSHFPVVSELDLRAQAVQGLPVVSELDPPRPGCTAISWLLFLLGFVFSS